MTRVVITAEVDDAKAWEKSFRTHGKLFRTQPATSPYTFGFADGNTVAVSAEVDDVDAYMASIESDETAEAMSADGVRRDTVRVFKLDHEFSF